jgi:hypothetical protein
MFLRPDIIVGCSCLGTHWLRRQRCQLPDRRLRRRCVSYPHSPIPAQALHRPHLHRRRHHIRRAPRGIRLRRLRSVRWSPDGVGPLTRRRETQPRHTAHVLRRQDRDVYRGLVRAGPGIQQPDGLPSKPELTDRHQLHTHLLPVKKYIMELLLCHVQKI